MTTAAITKPTPRPPVDEVEIEILSPEQKVGRQFSADLKDINSRMDKEVAAMNKIYAANDQTEKLAARKNLLPIILEAQDLFARPGRRDGGMTFTQWLAEWRPKLNVGRTAVYDMLAENNLGTKMLPLPKVNEERIVDGQIGRVKEVPPQEDGKMQEVLMEFPIPVTDDTEDENEVALRQAAVLAPRQELVLLADAKTLKHHTLDVSIIYDKPNGDWRHFANGKLVPFSTEAQRKAAVKAAKKVEKEAARKATATLEEEAAKLEAGKEKPLPRTVSKKDVKDREASKATKSPKPTAKGKRKKVKPVPVNGAPPYFAVKKVVDDGTYGVFDSGDVQYGEYFSSTIGGNKYDSPALALQAAEAYKTELLAKKKAKTATV